MANVPSKIDKLIKLKSINHFPHSQKDIEYIVESYLNERLSNEKMLEWLKAVYKNGMEFQETINYTNTIINSGKRIEFTNKK